VSLVRLRPVWMTNHPPSVLWHCCLGHQTCKNRWPYNLYCVGADVKPSTINQSALAAGLAVWTAKTKVPRGGRCGKFLIIKSWNGAFWPQVFWHTYFKVLLCYVKQHMSIWIQDKGRKARQHLLGTYQSTIQLQQFRLQNKVESYGFLSKCAEHVIWHRTQLAVALQQEKLL